MKKVFLCLPFLIIFLAVLSVFASSALAQCAGIETAIGCILVDTPTDFSSSILNLALKIGGGIAFILIVFGVFQVLTSSGEPGKIQAGKELITSAIAGLLLIVFSVFILRLIALDILKIPGFS